jgi:hypothetical protein
MITIGQGSSRRALTRKAGVDVGTLKASCRRAVSTTCACSSSKSNGTAAPIRREPGKMRFAGLLTRTAAAKVWPVFQAWSVPQRVAPQRIFGGPVPWQNVRLSPEGFTRNLYLFDTSFMRARVGRLSGSDARVWILRTMDKLHSETGAAFDFTLGGNLANRVGGTSSLPLDDARRLFSFGLNEAYATLAESHINIVTFFVNRVSSGDDCEWVFGRSSEPQTLGQRGASNGIAGVVDCEGWGAFRLRVDSIAFGLRCQQGCIEATAVHEATHAVGFRHPKDFGYAGEAAMLDNSSTTRTFVNQADIEHFRAAYGFDEAAVRVRHGPELPIGEVSNAASLSPVSAYRAPDGTLAVAYNSAVSGSLTHSETQFLEISGAVPIAGPLVDGVRLPAPPPPIGAERRIRAPERCFAVGPDALSVPKQFFAPVLTFAGNARAPNLWVVAAHTSSRRSDDVGIAVAARPFSSGPWVRNRVLVDGTGFQTAFKGLDIAHDRSSGKTCLACQAPDGRIAILTADAELLQMQAPAHRGHDWRMTVLGAQVGNCARVPIDVDVAVASSVPFGGAEIAFASLPDSENTIGLLVWLQWSDLGPGQLRWRQIEVLANGAVTLLGDGAAILDDVVAASRPRLCALAPQGGSARFALAVTELSRLDRATGLPSSRIQIFEMDFSRERAWQPVDAATARVHGSWYKPADIVPSAGGAPHPALVYAQSKAAEIASPIRLANDWPGI